SKEFEGTKFSEKSNITCEGSFFLSGDSSLQLSGKVISPEAQWLSLKMTDMEVDWTLKDNIVSWNTIKGHFCKTKKYEGNLLFTGLYDLTKAKGELLVSGHKISWGELSSFLTRLGGKEPDKETQNLTGYVDAQCRLHLLYGWAGLPYYVEGDATLSIREADFWQAPLMRSLGTLLGSSSFGKISEVDADLHFRGTHLELERLNTNGTIFALSATGTYSWLDDTINMKVSGEALKEISLLKILFKPLTWAFHAELVGPRKEAKWKLRSAFRKLIFSN
ncbi:MAG: hypothetical protein IJJ26_06130, partial [Victivallales bacterium]|nr:hypothetical protein [Victivallales bacterium]